VRYGPVAAGAARSRHGKSTVGDADGYPDRHANPYAQRHPNSYAHEHGDADANRDFNTNEHTNTHRHSDPDAHGHGDPDPESYAEPNALFDANFHSFANGHQHPNAAAPYRDKRTDQ
jgi:hypothetical protein